MTISTERRHLHRDWLLKLTSMPTATGHEQRVIDWVEAWVQQRPELALTRDAVGNLTIALQKDPSDRPLYITAHLDHPAFHVERVDGRTLELTFRGGVMDDYFLHGQIRVHHASNPPAKATLLETTGEQRPFKRFVARLDTDAHVVPGDFATWDLPASEIDSAGQLHAPVCDDLAAGAGALAAMDELIGKHNAGEDVSDVRLLFTLGEEVGFIGAIGACRHGTIPSDARVIALENSRAMPEAPIGQGPIVRVGDRLTIFSPTLTRDVAKVCERLAGGPPPTASQKLDAKQRWRWQRRLMSGGACEATVFCAHDLEATCVCLPLGNYHNMGNLDAMQASQEDAEATIMPETIAIEDFEGLVDLLVACGQSLGESQSILPKLDELWQERKFVLGVAPDQES